MKQRKYWLGMALLGLASHSFAQNEVDALRYSRTQPVGTARTLGIGGASVALGADAGSVATNPAGLGLFRSSEFTFTPGLGIGNTDSRIEGVTATDSRNSLHIANLGLVFANRKPDTDQNAWRGGAAAFSITRVNDLNSRFHYRHTPAESQDLLSYLNRNPGIDQQTDFDDLAYEAFLTEKDAAGIYVPADYDKTGPLTQTETVLNTGSQTQFDFGYGASYRDKLYLGGSIGILSTRFNSTKTLGATDPSPADPSTEGTSFSTLEYRETLKVRGTGVNLRVGAIYQPTDAVRLGASIQTPTYMQLSESYSSTMNTTFDRPITVDGKTYSEASAGNEGEYDYALVSPFRASGGLAVIIGKFGFLTGDVEYVNYGQARLSNTSENEGTTAGTDFSYANDAVRTGYQQAVNLRIGGEARVDIFRLRAGFARYGDPYKVDNGSRTQDYITGGVGLRQKNFFLDAAGVYNTTRQYYSPYSFSDAAGNLDTDRTPIVNLESSRFTTSITAGFLF
ncbi:hypothetical protein HER32_09610 [Hymenobacter sp. BT18]|uniref:OmpP1/FadL family transporter n=1 Tax=Hymenobacter sp. BT18 TaxID=2835648 RepID=UPI00143E22E7|nr:hypothetical protein [Hymenobacter sp. BT18]QIX61421.1 hypothetical protein HER32_09610 [Hymenobacter sp. BT18]